MQSTQQYYVFKKQRSHYCINICLCVVQTAYLMYLIDINVVLRVNNSEKYQLCYLFYYVIPIFYFQGLRPLRAEGNVIHSLAFNATHKYRFKILFHTSPEGFKEKHSPHMSSKSYLLNRKQTIYQYITDPCCLVSIHADFY